MMQNALLYEVESLASARAFLRSYQDKIIITNPKGSTRYYGMLVLDYMFKILRAEFSQITEVIVNVDNDNAALFTARKLGYQHIIITTYG